MMVKGGLKLVERLSLLAYPLIGKKVSSRCITYVTRSPGIPQVPVPPPTEAASTSVLP